MLTTNEIEIGTTVTPVVSGIIAETVAWITSCLIPILFALWRRAASKSNLQTTIINAVVRGIENSSGKISEDDTQFVKKSVRNEATAAGVQQHVEKIVADVKKDMQDRVEPKQS